MFGIDDALGIASAGLGLLGAGKGKTKTEMPIYDPRANELLDLLSGRSKDLMNKPYQSPALLRYNPTSVFQQSPVLAAIQSAIDQSMTQAGAQPQQDAGMPQASSPDMQDAASARAMYGTMQADPYGMIGSNRKGGRLGYTSNAPMNGSDADLASFYRSWMNPTADNRSSYIENVLNKGSSTPPQTQPPMPQGMPRQIPKELLQTIDYTGGGGSNMGPRYGQGAGDGFMGNGTTPSYIANILKSMGQ